MKYQFLFIVLQIGLLLCFSFYCFGQQKPRPDPKSPRSLTATEINSFFGQTTRPFRLSIRLKSRAWNGRDPLVVDAVFTNTSKQSIFIDLKKDFQFNGDLDNARYGLGHHVEWKQGGRVFGRKKDDHTEIPVGGKVVFTLTSSSIGDALGDPDGSIPWSKHRPGYYKFFINYVSRGKTIDFPGQWVGQAVSNEVSILVK